jgi:hypothetical protein
VTHVNAARFLGHAMPSMVQRKLYPSTAFNIQSTLPP